MTLPVRSRLQVEFLEAREVPSAPTETFDSLVPPSLPGGWGRWSNTTTDIFSTVTGLGVDGTNALVGTAGSRGGGRTWFGSPVSADTGAEISIKADTLIPVSVFARGTNLDGSTPTYLAAVVTRGLKVELRQVIDGVVTVLGSVASPASSYLSGQWIRVSIVPTGNSVAVRVTRADTGHYLNANGTWQAAPTDVIAATTTLAGGTGFVGVGRSALYAGSVSLDNFTVLTPTPTSVSESFDTTPAGAIPEGWQAWLGGGTGTLGTTPTRSLSPANGIASTGGSTTAARAWATLELPADMAASAAVYLDGLIPARVFVRGADLNGTTPTYYAASITRGLSVSVVRVVNGVETNLGSLQSRQYVSAEWVRVQIIAEGNRLRVVVYRTDTQQWLTADGGWSDSPDFALEKLDSTIAGPGKAGIARAAAVSGTLVFDDFEAHSADAAVGPVVSVAPTSGSNPFSGDVTFRATATGNPTRIEFRLDNVLRSVAAASPANWTLDSTTLTNGTHTLTVRAIDTAGNMGSVDFVFTTSNPGQEPIPTPVIPRHYRHIRIAELAYSGNPMGTFEQNLLRNSVDLVIPNTRYLSTIQAVAPETPQLIYSNVSNLYQGLLTDWARYADARGVSRELAFYHVRKATSFIGTSPSSQPVTWFWGVYQTIPGGTPTDVTSAARGGRNFNVTFGGAGTTTAIGFVEKFRQMNVSLVSGAGAGWSGVWEYVSAVDVDGNPTQWRPLLLRADGTSGLTQSGAITFDPPADWVAASVGGSDRLLYVRFRVTDGTADQAPELQTILGRDYVDAGGTYSGVIPAFDHAADVNHDGYLNDAEYAHRAAGLNARFEYESRLFYPYYGQMRFVTNPSDLNVRRWAANYHVRLLSGNPLADGVFVDNATGRIPFPGISVLEPTSMFGIDSGALVGAISRAIQPKWVLANTAGGGADAAAIAANSVGVFEEFLLRPLQANWSEVGDAVNLVNSRLAPGGAPYLVIDTHPGGGSATDARTQTAALAYYYLVADPERTFLMFFGGSSPSTSWTGHWSPAAAVDVGAPVGAMRVFAAGFDPLSPMLNYKVFARDYENALVLYKPLSYKSGIGEGTRNEQTATTHQLGGSYRRVNADGTLGPVITSIRLRNGEGAVLIRA
jgi:Big-like domain-containing protein